MFSYVKKIETIPEFFSGKNVFITGGSGFIGKILIEKLLRSCPDIGNIYMLIREKKGKRPEERIKSITDLPLFDVLKKQNQSSLEKIVPIYGDVMELKLGIKEDDRKTLVENVNVIFHAAASVRFDDHLREAIIINTRSTREVINLALETKKLFSFVHVSTTYCNTDRKVVDEEIYPARTDWWDAINIAEEMDPHVLDIFAAKYINPYPNTYTFTKSLAEQVVKDMCTGKIPTVIYRPSVVTATLDDPFPGWIDNINGPVGLLIAGGKGILRISYGDSAVRSDIICADLVVKTLIIAAWDNAINGNSQEILVYNGCKGNELVPLTMADVLDMGKKLTWEAPFTQMLWYPRFKMTSCWYEFYIKTLLYHMVPAFFIDLLLRILGKKPMLFKIQRKVYIANMALHYFMTNTWSFINTKTLNLDKKLEESDKEAFGLEKYTIADRETVYNFFKTGKIAVMSFILNEKVDLEKGLRNTRRLWLLDIVVKVVMVSMGFWLLLAKTNLLPALLRRISAYAVDLK